MARITHTRCIWKLVLAIAVLFHLSLQGVAQQEQVAEGQLSQDQLAREQAQEAFVSSSVPAQSIIDILSNSVGNPPERGAVPLGTFTVVKGAKKFNFPFNRYLSLEVTDFDSVRQISFSQVMGNLAKQSGDPTFTKEILFDQWWDTANKKPGLALGGHCDDFPPSDKLNNFPYRCPRDLEGKQATNPAVFTDEPDGDNAYSAIAFINRFDLISPAERTMDGQYRYPDCGEYRIIFARNSGRSIPPDAAPAPGAKAKKVGNKFQRNLIAFEARIKNPDRNHQNSVNIVPSGCVPILNFWYSLSNPGMSGIERGKRLSAFFLAGTMTGTGGSLPTPIVDVRNYSYDAGQIRTNQFINNVTFIPGRPPSYGSPGSPPETNVQPNDWMLREFRSFVLNHTVRIEADSTKSTPGSNLFKSPAPVPNDPRIALLVRAIHAQTEDLLGGKESGQFKNVNDINAIRFFTLKQGPNAFESDESIQAEGDIIAAYANNNAALAQDIQNDLNAVNYSGPIKPSHMVDRIRTQTCAGCHQFSDTQQKATNGTIFGFDPRGSLGEKAVWPTKACGDVDGTCTLPADAVLLTNKAKIQHPPMQFTQISELILAPSTADGGNRWKYSISTTVECMLDYREKFFAGALHMTLTTANNCPQ
jgi:hypothetical protein